MNLRELLNFDSQLKPLSSLAPLKQGSGASPVEPSKFKGVQRLPTTSQPLYAGSASNNLINKFQLLSAHPVQDYSRMFKSP
jgi:hypothetical protein